MNKWSCALAQDQINYAPSSVIPPSPEPVSSGFSSGAGAVVSLGDETELSSGEGAGLSSGEGTGLSSGEGTGVGLGVVGGLGSTIFTTTLSRTS